MPARRPARAAPREAPLSRVPGWLTRFGTASWLILGIVALVVAAYIGLAQLSGLLIPLVIALVIGALFHPVVDRLQGLGIPRATGATLVLLGLVAVTGLSIYLAIRGVIDQSDLIGEQLQEGWSVIQNWLASQGIGVEDLENLWGSISAGGASSGASGLISAGFSSAAAFLLGLFIGTFLLYYLLKDWRILRDWAAVHLGLPEDLGSGLIDDTTDSIRRYFYGLALASIPVSILIGLAMLLLGLPLAFTVAVVTFVTSFIPYIGAIISGAFAVLVALGAGGLVDGAIMLVVIVLTQNVVQTILLTKITSEKLSLHPTVNLGSTIVGATLAGLLGATLSAPTLAAFLSARKRVAEYYAAEPDPGEPPVDVREPPGGR